MTRPTIAVYAITKDESARLARMLKSTEGADLVVVCDTGSSDDSIQVARDFGAQVHQITVKPWRYDTARNVAMALIPDNIDLCMRLDTDELLCAGWREAIDRAYDPKVPRYQYLQITEGTWWHKVLRNDLHRRHGFFWRYPTHEILDGPHTAKFLDDLWVDHLTDLSKPRPNLDILHAEVLRDPFDTRMAFYYARELVGFGMRDEARTQLQRFIAMDHAWATEKGEAYRLYAQLDNNPEHWLWKAIAEDSLRREPFADMARLFHRQGQIGKAAAMYAIASSRTDVKRYITSYDCWGEPWDDFGRELGLLPERNSDETPQP